MKPLLSLGTLMGAGRGGAAGSVSLISGIADGAHGGYPMAIYNAANGRSYLPSVAATGKQYLDEVDPASGAVLNRLELSTAYNGINDDHMYPVVCKTPLGALLVAYCGHNTDNVMRFRRSSTGDNAGFGVEYTKATGTGNTTTYPQFLVHESTGHIYLLMRLTNLKWHVMVSTDDGLTWGLLNDMVTDATNQMYCMGGWVGTDTIRFFANYNSTIGSGVIYCFELNVVTGAVTSGAGTLCNIRTGSGAPFTQSSATAIVSPGAGVGASTLQMGPDGNSFAFWVSTLDNTFYEYWYAKFTGSDPFNSAHWTKTKIVDGNYGVGDLDIVMPYRWPGRHCLSLEQGLTYPRSYLSRNLRGTYYLERWDAQNADGTSWLCTGFFDSLAMGLSDALITPNQIKDAPASMPFYYGSGTHRTYTNWTRGFKWPIIRSGAKPPTITNALSFSTPEWKALEMTLTADQPVGWRISGGADAALFDIAGNKLYLQAKTYLSPSDANTDNVYEVEVTAVSLSGLTVAATIAVTVTQAAYAPANMLLQSQVFSNASWAKSSVTITQNTADLLDPLGTNLAAKMQINSTSPIAFRVQQAVSVSANTQYTLSLDVHAGTSNYVQLNAFDGTVSYGMNFDVLRGKVVAPRVASGQTSVVPTAHGMISLGNGWYRCFITFTVGASASSLTCQLILTQSAGSATGGFGGITTNTLYIFGAQLNTGALGDYVARTT